MGERGLHVGESVRNLLCLDEKKKEEAEEHQKLYAGAGNDGSASLGALVEFGSCSISPLLPEKPAGQLTEALPKYLPMRSRLDRGDGMCMCKKVAQGG